MDLEKVSEGFLRKSCISANPQHFGIFSLELWVIFVRTGRLKVLKSNRAKVQDIEIDENIFAAQAAELKFSSNRTGKLKVGRPRSHFHR